MQLLSAYIAVAGDDQNVVVREYDTAITFPEMLVLKVLHGSEHVRNIKDAGDVERDPMEERARLSELYGADLIKQVFPGEYTPVPTEDPRRKREAPPIEQDPFDTRKTAAKR